MAALPKKFRFSIFFIFTKFYSFENIIKLIITFYIQIEFTLMYVKIQKYLYIAKKLMLKQQIYLYEGDLNILLL